MGEQHIASKNIKIISLPLSSSHSAVSPPTANEKKKKKSLEVTAQN